MSTGEMQACLARLYVDEPFRKLLYLDPETALDGYRLTPEEDAAIRGIDRDSLDQFASSLIAKRRKQFERAYPLLFRVGGSEIRRYYARFYQLYTAKPYHSSHQEVIDFGNFVEESLANAEHLPAYANDVARYERLYYWTKVSSVWDAEPPAQAPAQPQRVDMDDRPFLNPDVTVAEYAHDVAAIEEAVQRGDAPDDIRAVGSCCILFRPGNGESGVQMLRISAPVKTLLDCCDGRRTVAQIVAEAEAVLGADDLRSQVIESIDRLLASHVLAVGARGAQRAPLQHRGYASATQIESM